MLGPLIKKERIAQNLSQEGLSKGICSVSYLSKIESNQVSSSNEILEMLFDQMGIHFIHDPLMIQEFQNSYQSYMNTLFYDETEFTQDMEDDLLLFAEMCLYSNVYLEAEILRAHLMGDVEAFKILKGQTLSVEKHLEYSILYALILDTVKDYDELLKTLLPLVALDNTGSVIFFLAHAYYINGYYIDSITHAQSAYQQYSDNGNLIGMHASVSLVANSYSNLNEIESAIKHYEILKRIGKHLNLQNVESETAYNIGSTYLAMNQAEKALHYLLSIKGKSAQTFDTLSKLVLTYTDLNDSKNARMIFSKIQQQKNPFNQGVYEILNLMIHSDDAYKNPELIPHLKNLLTLTDKNYHFGFERFYANILVKTYLKQNKYKQAYDLSTQYTL